MSQETRTILSRSTTGAFRQRLRKRGLPAAVAGIVAALCASFLGATPASAEAVREPLVAAVKSFAAPLWQPSTQCWEEFPYLVPHTAVPFADEAGYLNLITMCSNSPDPSVPFGTSFLIYNGSPNAIDMPDAAQEVDGFDGVYGTWPLGSSEWSAADYELTRFALGLDSEVDPVVLPGEYAQVDQPYGWRIDYATSVAWLAQTEIVARVNAEKAKAYKQIFVGRSQQRKAVAECVKAAWEIGEASRLVHEELTSEELFSTSEGLADSSSQCAKAWKKAKKPAAVQTNLPSLKKSVVVIGSNVKYTAPTNNYLRTLMRAASLVK